MGGRSKREGPVNYFELPRKQLQSLCKKYGFPANKTNLLMAQFLTSHLNSPECLNRDISQPSPVVKTRFPCRGEEPTTDNEPSTMSESLPPVAERDSSGPSHELTRVDVARTARPLEASEATGTGLGQVNQIESEDAVEPSIPSEDLVDSTSCFRIRDACLQCQSASVQDTPLLPATTEEAMEISKGCETLPRATFTGSVSGEDAMGFASTGFGSPKFSAEAKESPETPLPLSVMPYVRPPTPANPVATENGVKLFVDLQNDGLSPGENQGDSYPAWRSPATWNVPKAQDEEVLERVEKSMPVSEFDTSSAVISKAIGAAEDQFVATAAGVSRSRMENGGPLKSCLLTPTRKPSQLSVSFLSSPIFSSPRSIKSMVLDAERSVIVKEWSTEQTHGTVQPLDVISCTVEDEVWNEELVFGSLDDNVLAKQPGELNSRTLNSGADMNSSPTGVVPKAVQTYEEQISQLRGPSSIKRVDSYKGSPFLKSSHFAAELERASKLGQTRRIGILALKRATGLAPVFSDTQEDAKKANGARSNSAAVIAVSKANTSSVPLQCPDNMVNQYAGMSVGGGVSSSDVNIEAQAKPLVANALQNEITMLLSATQALDEKDEQIPGQTDISSDNVEGNNKAPVDEAKIFPATADSSLANLSWMTKPIEVPERRSVHLKARGKPLRPFSQHGRTLELMEKASAAKFKLSKKSTFIRGEVISKPSKNGRIIADRKDPTADPFGVCPEGPDYSEDRAENVVSTLENDVQRISLTSQAEVTYFPASAEAEERSFVMDDEKRTESPGEEVQTPCEVKMLEGDAEIAAAILESDVHSISPSTQPEMVDLTGGGAAEEGRSSVLKGETPEESACDAFMSGGMGETVAELNVQQFPEITDPVSRESHRAKDMVAKTLSFLDIDFRNMNVQKTGAGPPPRIESEIDVTNIREQIAADKFTPLSPLDSNKLAVEKLVENSPSPTTPTKSLGFLEVFERDGKNSASGLSLCGKENEWSTRQEQHKTPLTGRSKEKSLRTAERNASTLRAQLLKKRRGMTMTEGQIDQSDSPGIDLSPLKQLVTNRLLL